MISPDLAETVKRLRELAGRATPGPYMVSGIRSHVADTMLSIYAGDGKVYLFVAYSDRTPADHVASHTDANFAAACDPQTISSILDALEGLERERDQWTVTAENYAHLANNNQAAVTKSIATSRARITSLESSLAEARKGARTAGTVEVCAECGGNYEDGKAAFAIHDCPGLNDRPCPIRLAQETAEKEGG